jgi:hypothetical protein
MNALRIVLPVGLAAFIAALVIGYTHVSLQPGADCGSAFGGFKYSQDTSFYVACAPLLSEKELVTCCELANAANEATPSTPVPAAGQRARCLTEAGSRKDPGRATSREDHKDAARLPKDQEHSLF